jgi:hypothetical protein
MAVSADFRGAFHSNTLKRIIVTRRRQAVPFGLTWPDNPDHPQGQGPDRWPHDRINSVLSCGRLPGPPEGGEFSRATKDDDHSRRANRPVGEAIQPTRFSSRPSASARSPGAASGFAAGICSGVNDAMWTGLFPLEAHLRTARDGGKKAATCLKRDCGVVIANTAFHDPVICMSNPISLKIISEILGRFCDHLEVSNLPKRKELVSLRQCSFNLPLMTSGTGRHRKRRRNWI